MFLLTNDLLNCKTYFTKRMRYDLDAMLKDVLDTFNRIIRLTHHSFTPTEKTFNTKELGFFELIMTLRL